MSSSEPWRGLPAEVAELIEPELPTITEEILATIPREVPEYARPFEGSFGRGVRTGVTEALRHFVALVRDPEAGRDPGRGVYVALGRGELHQGRTLDSLQAAYRVGARVAWRRMAELARRAGLDAELLSLLAESIFAYIDELSADSVEGYAQAQSELEGERQRRRRELVALVLREPPAEESDLLALAASVRWRPPASTAALAVSEHALDRVVRGLAPDTLAAPRDGAGCVLVADPDGPGRRAEIHRAVSGRRDGDELAALGPTGSVAELGRSWRLALAALRAGETGAIGVGGLVVAEERLAELLLLEGAELVGRIAARRLAPLQALTPKARARMEETTLAYLRERGNAAAMARSMHVHPQSARYRLARLRELLGEALDDPDARFELELALRARALGNAQIRPRAVG